MSKVPKLVLEGIYSRKGEKYTFFAKDSKAKDQHTLIEVVGEGEYSEYVKAKTE